ncbi:hypothetical protein M0P48_05100 [Candidatus Gracilibacteria bacterium]|jgi:hypothetical protein|nr:hypothetical protein [Candidatus Gracilibacteria bacterium]
MQNKFTEFDFFMDEDMRSKRIGILCMEKTLTPALTQALFRVKEEANEFHKERIDSLKLDIRERIEQIKLTHRQIREVKWSSLNLMRSFIASAFVKQFFYHWRKGPLPIMFFNTPFLNNHHDSIRYFFDKLTRIKIETLAGVQNSNSVFFLDTFTTTSGYRFEEKVRNSCNLSRCFRIDSRAHDLIQLADILLGITVFKKDKKETSSGAKLRILRVFELEDTKKNNKATINSCEPIVYL